MKVNVHLNILSRAQAACHDDANGFKPRSNLKLGDKTNKHAAKYPKDTCLDTK